jgi:hypothetical protein
MAISACAVHIFMNGLMSSTWDSPQRHVTTLMLYKFVKSYILIVV